MTFWSCSRTEPRSVPSPADPGNGHPDRGRIVSGEDPLRIGQHAGSRQTRHHGHHAEHRRDPLRDGAVDVPGVEVQEGAQRRRAGHHDQQGRDGHDDLLEPEHTTQPGAAQPHHDAAGENRDVIRDP